MVFINCFDILVVAKMLQNTNRAPIPLEILLRHQAQIQIDAFRKSIKRNLPEKEIEAKTDLVKYFVIPDFR